MLSAGVASAPWPGCLRCQLRLVLRHLRTPALHQSRPFVRPFSIQHRLREQRDHDIGQDTDGHEADWHNGHGKGSGVYYRHVNPHGRLVGKPGRQQMQSSEPLAINSLGERSEVIVLRDIVAAKRKSEEDTMAEGQKAVDGLDTGGGKVLSAEEIQAMIEDTDATPSDDEVYASIDALRPQSPFLEEEEFDNLVNQLLEGYNVQQLSQYLQALLGTKRASEGKAMDGSVVVFRTSRWSPGRTPIEKRRLTNLKRRLPKGAPSHAKSRVADKILRIGWEVKTHSEEQQIGELEMQVLPWHLALLFDLSKNGTPRYDSLLNLPLLVRSSEIKPYRPSNIVRVTARRRDAEEIARQLEIGLMHAGGLTCDLQALRPVLPKQDRDKKWRDLFRTQDLHMISESTQCILELPDNGKAGFYSFHLNERETARRLLMSLLGLPDVNSRSLALNVRTTPSNRGSKRKPALLPVFAEAELHLRHRGIPWVRAMQPLEKQAPMFPSRADPARLALNSADEIQTGLSKLLADPVLAPHTKDLPPASPSSYWIYRNQLISNPWEAQLGQHLLPSSSPRQSTPHVFLHRVPAVESLLNPFVPSDLGPKSEKALLVAHFTPSPFTPRGASVLHILPSLQLSIYRSDLSLRALYAVLAEQSAIVPLPHLDTDVRLHRNMTFYAKPSRLNSDPAVQAFLAHVRRSADSLGPLRALSEVVFKLPPWLFGGTAQDSGAGDVEVPYLFDRFEQRTGMNLTPTEQATQEGGELQKWPKDAKLKYSEVEGGVVFGRRLEVSLNAGRTTEPRELLDAAMEVGMLITRAGVEVPGGRMGRNQEEDERNREMAELAERAEAERAALEEAALRLDE